MKNFFLAITIAFTFSANAQSVAINNDGSSADNSAILDLKSNNQGVLVPRMTAALRGLIATPATGLMVYQTDATAGFYFYNGTAWTSLSGPTMVFAAQKNAQQVTNLTGSSGSNTVPDVITFGNVTTSPPASVGSWDATTSTYTVGTNGAGLYLLSAQGTDNFQSMLPMIEINPAGTNTGNPVNQFSLFGAAIGNAGAVSPYRFRGFVEGTVFLSANSILRVRIQPNTTVLGSTLNGDGSCFFRIVKLN